MDAARHTRRRGDYLSDALSLLPGWTRNGREISRTLELDDQQHAALTERIKVVADALQLRPQISRHNRETRIRLGVPPDGSLTAGPRRRPSGGTPPRHRRPSRSPCPRSAPSRPRAPPPSSRPPPGRRTRPPRRG